MRITQIQEAPRIEIFLQAGCNVYVKHLPFGAKLLVETTIARRSFKKE